MKRYNLDIWLALAVVLAVGIAIGYWALPRHEPVRVVTQTVIKTVTLPPADYGYLKAEAATVPELKSELAISRATNRRIPAHAHVSTDDVSRWENVGVLREAQATRRACNLNPQ